MMRDFYRKLSDGSLSYDFLGRWRRWLVISAVIVVLSLLGPLLRGMNLGIEFLGGADFQAPVQVTDTTVDDMRAAITEIELTELEGSTINSIGDGTVRVQTRTLDPTTEVPVVRDAIAAEVGVSGEEVAYSLIGATWGEQITERAGIALVIFLVLVAVTIWIYFRDWKMSVAAMAALLHDLVVTIGVYAWVGFTVTPATVIGVLTILGYSLYDTVVVFDRVRENVADLRSQRRTYTEAANSALNTVLNRSLNTTIIGVLPVLALLVAGAVVLGQGPLQDLALALLVGMIAGAYSSIFLATVVLALLKEREPEMVEHRRTVTLRQDKQAKEAAGREQRVAESEITAETVETGGGLALLEREDESTPPASEPSSSRRHGEVRDAASGRPQPHRGTRSSRKKRS